MITNNITKVSEHFIFQLEAAKGSFQAAKESLQKAEDEERMAREELRARTQVFVEASRKLAQVV